MRDFNLNGKMIAGQYVAVDSPVHAMEPAAKLAGFGILLLAAAFSPRLPGIAFGVAITLWGMTLSKMPIKNAIRGLITPLPFLIIVALLQVFIVSETDPNPLYKLWFLQVSLNGLKTGLLLMLRFTVLMLMLNWMSFSVSPSENIYGLQRLLKPLQQLGIQPMDFVMTIQIMARFLPILAQSAERIAKAQASRGADWDGKSGGLIARVKRIVPLILPLFTASLRRAEKIAMAMDARAYGYHADRTSMAIYHFQNKDAMLLLAAMASAMMMILL